MGIFKEYEDRPSCSICGEPADMQDKLPSGKIIWRRKNLEVLCVMIVMTIHQIQDILQISLKVLHYHLQN